MLKLTGRDLEGAIADFTKALSLDGRLALAHANRGLALMLQGKDEAAERDLSRALELSPTLRAQVEAGVSFIMRQRR